jgi:hypothetical protein
MKRNSLPHASSSLPALGNVPRSYEVGHEKCTTDASANKRVVVGLADAAINLKHKSLSPVADNQNGHQVSGTSRRSFMEYAPARVVQRQYPLEDP